ncbi:hypothetical protein HMPREF3192_00803 [Atopobium deltae]|uniref:Uncharacterized protein n=1 Tax=Atopobium deltae TaxID=1393034 RepID=A0A133XUS2_9ACTN|nr:hypothetical protein HMPREF3192_00803 [Atopobium deltae]
MTEEYVGKFFIKATITRSAGDFKALSIRNFNAPVIGFIDNHFFILSL